MYNFRSSRKFPILIQYRGIRSSLQPLVMKRIYKKFELEVGWKRSDVKGQQDQKGSADQF